MDLKNREGSLYSYMEASLSSLFRQSTHLPLTIGSARQLNVSFVRLSGNEHIQRYRIRATAGWHVLFSCTPLFWINTYIVVQRSAQAGNSSSFSLQEKFRINSEEGGEKVFNYKLNLFTMGC